MKRAALKAAALILALFALPRPAHGAPIRRAEGETKKIALSFDDGPSRENCGKILRILDRYGIRATFFIVGKCAEEDPDHVREIYEAGHEIGNHTYSHANITRLDADRLRGEVKKTEKILTAICGERPRVFRPPEGGWNEAGLAVLTEMGYQTVLWSVDTRDWTRPKPASIAALVDRETHGGDILLFHDLGQTGSITPDALEAVIPSLLEKGFEFVTVSALLSGTEN